MPENTPVTLKLVAVKYTGDLANVTNSYGEFQRDTWRILPNIALEGLSKEFESRDLNSDEAAIVAGDLILGITPLKVISEPAVIPSPSNSTAEPKVGN